MYVCKGNVHMRFNFQQNTDCNGLLRGRNDVYSFEKTLSLNNETQW